MDTASKQKIADMLSSIYGFQVKVEDLDFVDADDAPASVINFKTDSLDDLYRQRTIDKFIDEFDDDDDYNDDDDLEDILEELPGIMVNVENMTINININKD